MKLTSLHIGILGAGTMGSTFVARLIETETVLPGHIKIFDRNAAKVAALKKQYGCIAARNVQECAAGVTVFILAIKPQNFGDCVHELATCLSKSNTAILSIMAGVSIKTLETSLHIKRIVRAMPNTASKVGKGITVWHAHSFVSPQTKATAQRLLCALGNEIEVQNELLIDKATAISGSGPAYVYFFEELMMRAASELGVSKKLASQLVSKTFFGALELQRMSHETLEDLRKAVTSKGGTTAAALAVFEKVQLQKIMTDALKAAYKKARELRS